MSSKILCFPPEIVCHILSSNDNMFHSPNALKDLRMASQVSRSWHHTAISSPRLWGHLIDLDSLNVKSEEWLAVILHRSGTVPLWIKFDGTRSKLSDKYSALVIQLLESNWERVEILSLPFLGHQKLKFLHRPALSLRIFIYDGLFDPEFDDEVSDDDENNNSEDGSHANSPPLFADRAPVLRHLKISYIPSLHPTSHGSVFSNLRTLVTGEEVDLKILFDMLLFARRLEVLEINCEASHDHSSPPSNIVSLPRLRHLRLFSDEDCTSDFVLRHLELPNGLSLDLGLDIDLYSTEYSDLAAKVGLLAKCYFEIHQPTTLNLIWDEYGDGDERGGLLIETGSPITHGTLPFRVHLKTDDESMIYPFIRAFSFPDLACITTLHMPTTLYDLDEAFCDEENMEIIKEFYALLSGVPGLQKRIYSQMDSIVKEWDKADRREYCSDYESDGSY